MITEQIKENRKKLTKISVIMISFIFIFILLISSVKEEIVWSISIYTGKTPFDISPVPGLEKPILDHKSINDIKATDVADPFLIKENGKWYMFFEIINKKTGQGDLGLAASLDGKKWKYKTLILDERFHLSFPYVFKWENEYYMIPESREDNAVKLYHATKFPTEWEFVKNLLEGNFADPSIFHYNNKWWLFVLRNQADLEIFFADNIVGDWHPHPENPVVENDPNIARPGGRIFQYNNNYYRCVQDCYPDYGSELRIFKIDQLTHRSFEQTEIKESPVLGPGSFKWNSAGMHHMDPHFSNKEWIASVDGKQVKKTINLKYGLVQIKHFFESITK